MKKNHLLVFFWVLVNTCLFAQVGIGTTTPDASAILDITSTTQGVLVPRMSSAERISITSPANGLLVYDTTENAFYFYKASIWVKIDSNIRNNYKLIKSAADLSAELAAGGGTKYLLTSNTFYEINGAISLAQPIELNNAYLSGLDTNEDILIKIGGNMFTGNTGGTIKSLSLTVPGGTLFTLTGGTTENLIFRDCIVSGCNSVGNISGYGIVFLSIIQFTGNSNGIVYNNISSLLLSNVAWFGNNTGTFETYTGTFGLIEKQSGFCDVNGAAIGVNVSSNPTVNTGVMIGVSFSGNSTTYINKYTVGSFTGFNFNKNWSVNCTGIPKESDDVSTGYYNMNGNTTNTTFPAVNSPTKILGTTTATNLFRVTATNNRLTYIGSKPRNFEIISTATVDHSTGGNRTFAYYIYKNGVQLPSVSAERRFTNNDIGNLTLIGSVFMNVNDFIEVWVENQTNSAQTLLTKLSVSLR
jgi:hypothetical protein